MKIRHILVVGSGIMGSGISYASAVGGFETTVFDVSEESLKKAKKYHEEMLQKGVDRGKVSEQTMKDALNKLTYSSNLQDVAGEADFVIEAVPEVKTIK